MQRPAAIRLIIGLGNFPPEYADTRHNAGRWFVERLAAEQDASLRNETKLQSLVAKVTIDGVDCRLVAPMTFMNESGNAVIKVAHFYKIPPEQILVAHDELDFAAGIVKLKFGGGHGGHNGVASVIKCLSSPDFARLRIGIGHPGSKDLVTDYVLHRPSKSDRELIDNATSYAINVVADLLRGDFEKAIGRLGRKAVRSRDRKGDESLRDV